MVFSLFILSKLPNELLLSQDYGSREKSHNIVIVLDAFCIDANIRNWPQQFLLPVLTTATCTFYNCLYLHATILLMCWLLPFIAIVAAACARILAWMLFVLAVSAFCCCLWHTYCNRITPGFIYFKFRNIFKPL